MRAAQRGSEEAVEALFRRHWARRTARRSSSRAIAAAAEDIAQEAFIAALRALDRFDRAARSAVAAPHRRQPRDRLRRAPARCARGRRRRGARAGGARARRRGPRRGMRAALAALGPEQRAVVVLRYLLEYTPGEIAGCSTCRAEP